MIIRSENKLMEFNQDELKVLKFFFENSLKTLSDLLNDPMLGVDFVFPGIFDLDKKILVQVLNKLEDLGVETYKINPHRIQEQQNAFELTMDDFT